MRELSQATAYIAHSVENEGIQYLEGTLPETDRITWVAADGTVLFDNWENPETMDGHINRICRLDGYITHHTSSCKGHFLVGYCCHRTRHLLPCIHQCKNRPHSRGVAAKLFEALYDANININMISTSEIKISVLVDKKDAEKAVQVIHDKFFSMT